MATLVNIVSSVTFTGAMILMEHLNISRGIVLVIGIALLALWFAAINYIYKNIRLQDMMTKVNQK